jgi:AraC-like DNA-binding protein
MSDAPRSFAATPPTARPQSTGPDLLSDLLQAVRLTGAVFLNARLSAPFNVADRRRYDERLPMARLRHASILHLIVEGGCEFESGAQRRSVGAGDLVFHPLPDAYRFWSGAPTAPVDASEVVRRGPIEGVWEVDHGGGGPVMRMVCGFIESGEFLFAPVFRSLPPLLVEHTSDDQVGTLIASTVREITARVAAATPGSQAVLGRRMELLFVELLRRHVARLPAGARGWFAALNDPVVSRALGVLHADPAHRWTVQELAQRIGSSRTVLGERFKALLGRPPIDYLAAWRIQLASERLRAGHESVPRVAEAVGYESEASFSRAFRRVTGMTPGAWRQAAAALPG